MIVFPELALTTFFPRWYMQDDRQVDAFCETEMPNVATRPLFDLARRLRVAFYLGYAEAALEGVNKVRYNTSILVDQDGRIVGKYRKIHLPGHHEYEPWRKFQHLERRYFTPGDRLGVYDTLGCRVGMAICNDRRWAETYRVLALQGAELILIGYNTPVYNARAPELGSLALFHSKLSMQAGAYQNAAWVVGVAKAGVEEGAEFIGGSCIVAPSGEVVTACASNGDEVAVGRCDLDLCETYRRAVVNFQHRQPATYSIITDGKTGPQ
ncbi:putative amidohydrolase [Paraburkholderia caledonica]|uniref:Amidohydrolase n=1 Tax=Paraburkholderia caledonica TaxID=134536 RepID=A0AB73IMK7_9BURK|nr:putative amidohydrolase [Paraburkholderia caledonica]